MKKTVALLLSILMLALACGTALAEPYPLDVIIAEYGPNTREWFLGAGDGMGNGKNFVQAFEEANPDVKLNLEVVSWNDLATVVATRIQEQNAPDILNIDTFAQYHADGLLLPASDYISDGLMADFFPSFIEQSTVDGVCWAVPDLASARALYYNKAILDEVGVEVPATWAELEDVCEAIVEFYDGEIYPWGVDMTTDEGQAAFAYYSWTNNGGFVDAEGNWTLNSDANVEAVEFAVGLVNQGYTNPNPATQTRYDLQDMFAAGKLAMLIAPNQLPTIVKNSGNVIDYGLASIPHNEGASTASAGVMDRIMAFRDDAADQAVRNAAIGAFCEFFYDPANYVGWVTMEDFLPAVNSAVEAMVAADPGFQAWLDVLAGSQFYPTAKGEWADVKVGVIQVEQNALSGGDVRALLDELQARIAGA